MPLKVAITPRSSSNDRPTSTAELRSGSVFSVEAIDERPGICVLEVTGDRAAVVFGNESGGHRWQEYQDRHDRVHTSTVTVAVMTEPPKSQCVIDERDIEVSFCRGSGKGGQNRNKRDTVAVVKHVPTGLAVRAESERSQHANRESAMSLLRARLWQQQSGKASKARADDRRAQVGCGARGDKRRTLQVQHGTVVDHVTGKTWRYRDYAKGLW